jgi:ankyrin repeat protein
VVKLLLDEGAKLDSGDEIDQPPLLWAAGHSHETVVKLLLDKSADLDQR